MLQNLLGIKSVASIMSGFTKTLEELRAVERQNQSEAEIKMEKIRGIQIEVEAHNDEIAKSRAFQSRLESLLSLDEEQGYSNVVQLNAIAGLNDAEVVKAAGK